MALIKCPDCGKKISDKATVCIHCGCPVASMTAREATPVSATTTEKVANINFSENIEQSNVPVERHSFYQKKKLKSWHKIVIGVAAVLLLIGAATVLFSDSSNDDEAAGQTKDNLAELSSDTSNESEDNVDFVTAAIQYEFLDYTEFSTHWFDGIFRCGTDFEPGDYYILPLFGAGAMYEVADTPNDFSWTYYRLLRKICVTEGEYVNVAHGSIMVPAEEIDVNNWAKYGVFLVGKDISAGEYKMETLTDKYQSNLYGITGISGAYQLNGNDVEETPIDSNYLFGSQKYITLENGQYIIITNVKLTNVNATSSDTTTSNDKEGSDNTDTIGTSSLYNDSQESFISNGHFTFSARSFIKLFDEADKEAKGYNYTYMRMNGETSLFYELAEISGGYEKVRSAGMISFVKGVDTTLSIEEDYTENIITKINVLVEDVNDVPPILVGCMCAVDPALDFTTAYNLGMDIVEKAGTEDGYVHNGVKYVVATDGEFYYIIISIDKAPVLEESSEKDTANKDNRVTGDYHDNEDKEDNVSSIGVSKLTVSSTNVTLNNSSQAISITVPDSYEGDVNCTVENSDILSTSWGGWSGNTVTLTLIPNATGSTSLEIYLENSDSVAVNVSVSVTDYSPNAADYTTLRIAPATYYTFNDDESYSSDIVLLESANYKVSDNGDGTVNITIFGTMQRKTNNISTYIQIGYSLYVDGEDIIDGTVGTDAPKLNQSYNYTLELDGLQPGNYIIYFTSY